MTGVVGHPVSEKGERGGSPSRCNRERPVPGWVPEIELACPRKRDCAGERGKEPQVVSAGLARYRKPKWPVQVRQANRVVPRR